MHTSKNPIPGHEPVKTLSISGTLPTEIGNLLLTGASRGNQDNSNLDRALHAFEDLRQSYPGTKQAADAALKLTEIRSREIQRNFDIGEFYFKKEHKLKLNLKMHHGQDLRHLKMMIKIV